MDADAFVAWVLEEGGPSKAARDLLRLSRQLADLDRRAATQDLPLTPLPPLDLAVARRGLAEKIKKAVRAMGREWRYETGGRGILVTAPGRTASVAVPWA